MSFSKKNFTLAFGGFVVLFFILVFTGVIPGLRTDTKPTVTGSLTVWGLDTEATFQPLLQQFKVTFPGVSVIYRAFSNYTQYEDALIDALASGEGPDVFMIPNTGVPGYKNKIVPFPSTRVSTNQVREFFPQIVEQDFVSGGSVYALPLSVDTLALFYNRTLLDSAAVVVPRNWHEFQAAAPKLTIKNTLGNIVQAGAAIGGSRNVAYATDIVSLLMLQTGTEMTSLDGSSATFASKDGVNAVSFYSDFANTKSAFFSWSPGFLNSVDAFAQEKVAMIFGYASLVPELQRRNAFLSYGIASVPQPKDATRSISYPSYYGLVVSKQSKSQELAFTFILSSTFYEEAAGAYTSLSKKPPALRSLIQDNLNDPKYGVFSRQALTARSWKQVDPSLVQNTFLQMIQNVVERGVKAETALFTAQQELNRAFEAGK